MNKKSRSCILFTPASKYWLEFCYFLQAALQAAEIEVRTVNPRTSTDLHADLSGAIDESVLFFLSFACDCIGLETAKGQGFFELTGLPIVSFCESEPEVVSNRSRVIFALRDRQKISGNYYFAPHPGLCIDNRNRERDIEVAFCYDMINPAYFRERWRSDFFMAQICEDMLDILNAENRVTARQAFDRVMERNGIYLEHWTPAVWAPDCIHAHTHQNFRSVCIGLVNGFMKNRRRDMLLHALTRSGVCITAIPSLGVNEYLRLFQRSKIILSADSALEYSLPWQMSCGMASGAAVADEGNEFVDEVFTHNDYIPYSHSDYGTLAERIKETLADPSRLAEISENGRRVIEANYTLAHAVEKLVLAADYSFLLHG